VCAETSDAPVCEPAGESPIRVGMSAPISGTSQNLGIAMRAGVTLAFDEENAHGASAVVRYSSTSGTTATIRRTRRAPCASSSTSRPRRAKRPAARRRPRRWSRARNPWPRCARARTERRTRAPRERRHADHGRRTAPIAVESQTLFFGAFTGATLMLRNHAADRARSTCSTSGSYAEEARATLEYFLKQGVCRRRPPLELRPERLLRQAGYDGLLAAYTALLAPPTGSAIHPSPSRDVRYTRDDEASRPVSGGRRGGLSHRATRGRKDAHRRGADDGYVWTRGRVHHESPRLAVPDRQTRQRRGSGCSSATCPSSGPTASRRA